MPSQEDGGKMALNHGSSSGEAEYEGQKQLQEDELMALEAILPSSELTCHASSQTRVGALSSSSTPALLRLNVPAILPGPTSIIVRSHIFPVHFDRLNGHEPLLDEIKVKESKTSDNQRTPLKPKIQFKSKPAIQDRIEITKLESISYLPDLRLLLRLPKGYPNYAAPTILHITGDHICAACTDLPDLNAEVAKAKAAAASKAASSRAVSVDWLRKSLQQQWDSFQGEILYTWYEYLKESMWYDILASRSSDSCPLSEVANTLTFDEYVVEEAQTSGGRFESPLAVSLRSYDILSKRKHFEGERFGCGICLEEKRGGKCWKVSACGHVFCQECLSNYLASMIREGYIRQASACPDPDCVKARVAAENKAEGDHINGDDDRSRERDQVGAINQDELVLFVGPDLVKRLRQLQEKALATTDPTAGYCPRPGCEKLVRGDPQDEGTMYESMRMCECGFTYCLYCNKAWHGKSPCNIVSSTALIERYQNAGEGSTIRKEMELRYGRSNLEKMVKNHEEELQNRAYIESHTQRCPCCSVRIEKSMGCNHMTCQACHTHLCYRCGTRLNPNEPYRHFNTPGGPCFQKLFDIVGLTGEPEAWGFGGVNEEEVAQWEAEEL